MEAKPFIPRLFAHGRLLYRFEGSDACRFSPILAYRMIERLCEVAGECPVLWDPFCGTGLIVGIARLFFPRSFQAILASDVSPLAVECARKNLVLVGNVEAARKRLKELRGLQKMNVKSHRRCGEVADYLESLMPLIEQNERLARPVHAFVASAFGLPAGTEGEVHFMGDLPYGKQSRMAGGGGLSELLEAIHLVYPHATMTFVTTPEAAGDLPSEGGSLALRLRPCRKGRLLIHATPREAPEAT